MCTIKEANQLHVLLSFCKQSVHINTKKLLIIFFFISGIGMSFSYCSLLVAVDKYFTERKFIAMSLAILGGSFGMVIMPILIESLLQKYGFHGAMLVHAGISLHVIVCGAVVFPLPTGKFTVQFKSTRVQLPLDLYGPIVTFSVCL